MELPAIRCGHWQIRGGSLAWWAMMVILPPAAIGYAIAVFAVLRYFVR